MLRMLLISVIRVGIVGQGFAGGSREQSARKILAQGLNTTVLTTTMCQKPIVRPSSTVQRKTRSGCQAHDDHQQRVQERESSLLPKPPSHRTLLDDT
ncbi:unnamed protein product [Musa hybrid cultivar]